MRGARQGEGLALVEAVERLVCALYGVSPALTERVIASAISRAGATAAEAEPAAET